MDMTSKRTINAVKGKQFFQETVKAEPVTGANLEQAQAKQESTQYRLTSDIAQDFLPNGDTDTDDLEAMRNEMSRKRYAMEDAELQIEEVLVARDIYERFVRGVDGGVDSVEFQIGNERDFLFIENARALDEEGNTIYALDEDVWEILEIGLSSSSKGIIINKFYYGGEKYAKLDIAKLNKMWR